MGRMDRRRRGAVSLATQSTAPGSITVLRDKAALPKPVFHDPLPEANNEIHKPFISLPLPSNFETDEEISPHSSPTPGYQNVAKLGRNTEPEADIASNYEHKTRHADTDNRSRVVWRPIIWGEKDADRKGG